MTKDPWYDSSNPSTVVRGGTWRFGLWLAIVLGVIALVGVGETHVVNAPGDDGSYGANESGIFFFTTEGQMVTTNLDYIWSDNPLSIDTPRLG